jgi:hypothetical protein
LLLAVRYSVTRLPAIILPAFSDLKRLPTKRAHKNAGLRAALSCCCAFRLSVWLACGCADACANIGPQSAASDGPLEAINKAAGAIVTKESLKKLLIWCSLKIEALKTAFNNRFVPPARSLSPIRLRRRTGTLLQSKSGQTVGTALAAGLASEVLLEPSAIVESLQLADGTWRQLIEQEI